jgi:hypothetical protein
LPRSIRDAIVALSLANICFLSPWLVLLNRNHYSYYHWPADPGFVEIKALLICIVGLAFLIWLAATVLPRNKIARLALLLVLILPVNSVVSDYLRVSVFELLVARRWLWPLGLFLAVAVLAIIYRYNRQLTRVVITLLMILSPLLPVNSFSAIVLRRKHVSPPDSFKASRPATAVTTRHDAPRIVWIIFDELDQNTTFVNRSAGTKLPEFDRFRSESLTSTNAYPPNQHTLLSFPSLTTGHVVADATPVAANECLLTLPSGAKLNWSEQSNVFSEARSEGFSTGLSGWYNPYCRVIGASLDWCSWVPVVDQINPALDQLSLSRAVWIAMQTAAFRIPLAFRLFERQYERQRKVEHQEEFVRVSRASHRLLQQDLNLKLLHFPIPHHPWLGDGNGYVDNLILADRTLGEIRGKLEQMSQWDNSIVLVTSDHWWREAEKVNEEQDRRVPFMLKLASQKVGTEYQKPFNTVLTRELLLQLLRSNLTSPADVATWIDSHPAMDHD